MFEVKTIMERWARLRNVFIHVRAVNWIHLSVEEREREEGLTHNTVKAAHTQRDALACILIITNHSSMDDNVHLKQYLPYCN